MKRVTGIGGIFFKSEDPKKLYDWYERHLGIKHQPDSGAMFQWRDAEDSTKKGMTIWSIFPASTKYFNPSHSSFMLNYRVENLDELLKLLREEGIDSKREDSDYGKFAWIMDPDGNRIELWEPPKEK